MYLLSPELCPQLYDLAEDADGKLGYLFIGIEHRFVFLVRGNEHDALGCFYDILAGISVYDL